MTDPAARLAMLERVVELLREDGRIAGAVLVGSGATGFQDEESDLDVLAVVDDAHDAVAVYQDWGPRIDAGLPVAYRGRFEEARSFYRQADAPFPELMVSHLNRQLATLT